VKSTTPYNEVVLVLLQACHELSAKFVAGKHLEVTLPDMRKYQISERITVWRFTRGNFSQNLRKSLSTEELKKQIHELEN
jgi:hypothetical protein